MKEFQTVEDQDRRYVQIVKGRSLQGENTRDIEKSCHKFAIYNILVIGAIIYVGIHS
jgi:hypothetical protein